jgi:hypothetical protein
MEPLHYIQPVRASLLLNSPAEGMSCWDARELSDQELEQQLPEFLREVKFSEAHSKVLQDLRALLLVSPQSSDASALALAEYGIAVIKAPSEIRVEEVVCAFLQQVGRFRGATQHRGSGFNQDPAAQGHQSAGAADSVFSKYPSYFDQTLYEDWLGKLAEPWAPENNWDSES